MSEDTRRLISLTVLGVLVVAVVALSVMAAGHWADLQSRIAVAENRADLPPAADPQRYLIHAGSRGVATADLQSRVTEAARVAGVTMDRRLPQPADQNDALRLIIDVEASGTIGEISAFLHSVESTTPALIVTEASLRPMREAGELRLTATIEARLSPGAAQ